MKISKHIHSCLLIQDQNKTVLIDPGNFTAQYHGLDLSALPKPDFLLITHEHPDHMYIPLIKEIVTRFPDAEIITNPSAKEVLASEQIPANSIGNKYITFESAPHEKLWDREVPPNISLTVFGKVTDPGDSLRFTETAEVLVLPVTAPWGSTTAAIEKATKIKPKIIIPVHDWMWKDTVRKSMYFRLTGYFKTIGIDFKGLETGEVFEM